MDIRVTVLLILEGLLALGLLWSFDREIFFSPRRGARCVLLIFLALAVRLTFFPDENTDYQWFLKVWVEHFRAYGFAGLKYSIGNYNIPYMYFLALFAKTDIYDLYLIKLLSVLCDILLAYAVMRLLKKCGAGEMRAVTGFFIVLFIPTVILNSAKWGQCDSVYTAFALLALEAALPSYENRHRQYQKGDGSHCVMSMVFLAVSFGFKLQAVFIMPVFLLAWIWRRYSWYIAGVFPLTYFLLMLPAILLGRPAADALTVYLKEMNTVGSALNYNSPSLTALLRGIPESMHSGVSAALIVCAGLFMATILICGALCAKKESMNSRLFLLLTLLMTTGIPFFLPHMHDRYFFIADVLSCAAAVLFLQNIPAALLTQFGSLICYIAYFPGVYYRIGNVYLTNDKGAAAVLLAIMLEGALAAYTAHTYTDAKKLRR